MKSTDTSGKRGIARLAIAATTAFLAALRYTQRPRRNDVPRGLRGAAGRALAKPVIGFGAAGRVVRTPVVFLHGDGGVPYDRLHALERQHPAMAQYFSDSGYRPSELWALGYQGDQCDLQINPGLMSNEARTNTANVPDCVRSFARF